MAETETISDAKERQIEVRRLSRKDTMSFMRRWGTACNVETWLGNALLAAMVRSIDGIPVPPPQTADQVESLADRLDDPGLTAVAEWLGAQNAARDMAAELSAAKN